MYQVILSFIGMRDNLILHIFSYKMYVAHVMGLHFCLPNDLYFRSV